MRKTPKMDGLQWKTPIKMDDLGNFWWLFGTLIIGSIHQVTGLFTAKQPNDESTNQPLNICLRLLVAYCMYVLLKSYSQKKDEHYNNLFI